MKRDNLTIVLTPHLLERLQAAGLELGAGNIAVWLTEQAELVAEVKQALARAQGTVEHLRDREAAFLAALTAAGYAPADGGQYRADCASAVARMAEDFAALQRAKAENDERFMVERDSARNVLTKCAHQLSRMLAHVEDHGEDACSDAVYNDLLALRAQLAEVKAGGSNG